VDNFDEFVAAKSRAYWVWRYLTRNSGKRDWALGPNGLVYIGVGLLAGGQIEAVSSVIAATTCLVASMALLFALVWRQARDWGYQRISVGDTIIVMDAAPPPVSRLVEMGCASTLAIEVSDGTHRLVVNCGGARAGGAGMTPVLAQGLRTTAAHSTLTLSDSNSTSVHADGSLGKGVEEVELDRQEAEVGSRIEASHDGYARRYGFVHRRSMSVGPDGREIRGDDVLVPAQVRRKGQAATFAVRFHLGPDVEVSPTADGSGALLRISEGALWQFRSHGGALVIDDSLWVDGNGRIRATQQLVISGEVPAGGASVSWAFRRAG
jgi:uncharacterized heparinase superfamily protein